MWPSFQQAGTLWVLEVEVSNQEKAKFGEIGYFGKKGGKSIWFQGDRYGVQFLAYVLNCG